MDWDFWVSHTPDIEPYMKEAHFFQTFNVAWIFCWEYLFQHFLQPSIPLLIIHIYKVRWWNEFKIILCGKENVTHFLLTNTKKYMLFSLAQIEALQNNLLHLRHLLLPKWKPLPVLKGYPVLMD